MLGNKHISFPVAATVLYGIITMPEYWSKFKTAYKRGAASTSIKNWEWFSLIETKTIFLQHQIKNKL